MRYLLIPETRQENVYRIQAAASSTCAEEEAVRLCRAYTTQRKHMYIMAVDADGNIRLMEPPESD